jgi:hypothetical protein
MSVNFTTEDLEALNHKYQEGIMSQDEFTKWFKKHMGSELLKILDHDMAMIYGLNTDSPVSDIESGTSAANWDIWTSGQMQPALTMETLEKAIGLFRENHPPLPDGIILSTRKIQGGAMLEKEHNGKKYFLIHPVDLLIIESRMPKPSPMMGLCGLTFGIPVMEDDELVDEILGGQQ